MNGKSPDAFRTISEVADWLDRPAHVLRFWESKFTQVKPVKRAGGRRYYRPEDMLLLGGIKKLLHDDGMTIKGAQKVLREQGVRYVSALSQPLEDAGVASGVATLVQAGAANMATPSQEVGPADTEQSVTADAPPQAPPPHPVPDETTAPVQDQTLAQSPDVDADAPHDDTELHEDAAGEVPVMQPLPSSYPETTAEPDAQVHADTVGPVGDAAPDGPVDFSDAVEADAPAEQPLAEHPVGQPADQPETAVPATPVPLGADIPPLPDLDSLPVEPGPLTRIAALPGPVARAHHAELRALLARLESVGADMSVPRRG